MSRTTTSSRRVAAVGALVAAALVGLAGTAFAHVTVQPGTAEQGGFAKVAFRTPNESDTAATIMLEVTMPTEHPIPFVSTRPLAGWTVAVEKVAPPVPLEAHGTPITEVVSKITWSGGRIEPGTFQEFEVSMGPLPSNTDQLVFKAVQTYDNGEVSRWIELQAPGAPEPESPAPVLKLTKATEEAAAAEPAAADQAADSSSGGGGAALTFGIIGAVLGLVGAVLGGIALRRRTG